MSDNPASRPPSGGLTARFSLRRALAVAGTAVYRLVLWLAFDFAYSSLTRGEEAQRPARIANPAYDHGFAAGPLTRSTTVPSKARLARPCLG
jgi:hypothetical protein